MTRTTPPTKRELQVRRAIRNFQPGLFNAPFVRDLSRWIDRELTREDAITTERTTTMPNPLHELPEGATITYQTKAGEQVFDPNPQLKVGDRFQSRDSRDNVRIVRIVEVLGITDESTWKSLDRALFSGPENVYGMTREYRAELIRRRGTRYLIRNESTSRTVQAHEKTLREKFRQLPSSSRGNVLRNSPLAG